MMTGSMTRFLFLGATAAVGAVVLSLSSSAQETQRIAYSRSLGVEVFAVAQGGNWCAPSVELRIVADKEDFFTGDTLKRLVPRLGSLVRKDCAQANALKLSGVGKGGYEILWRGEAKADRGWAVATIERPPADSSVSTARTLDPKQLTAEVQRLLAERGFDPGPADGVYGPKTRAAIEAFQRQQRSPVDGQVTEALLARLQPPRPGSSGTSTTVAPPPQATAARPPTQPAVTEQLVQALDDLRWAVQRKLRRDVGLVAQALWNAREAAQRQGNLEPYSDLLAAFEQAVAKALSTGATSGLAERLSRASSSAEVALILALHPAPRPTVANQGAAASHPLHQVRLRTMLEVGEFYPRRDDYVIAVMMYLLGYRDLESPVRVADAGAVGDQTRVEWLSGAEAVLDDLQTQIDELVQAMASRELNSDSPTEELVQQLNRVRAHLLGPEAPALAAAATAKDDPVNFAFGAIRALAAIHEEAQGGAQPDTDVVQAVRVLGESSGDLGLLAWSADYRSADGQSLGTVKRQIPTGSDASIRPFSKDFVVKASALDAEIALEMLASLPIELSNVRRLIRATLIDVSKATGIPVAAVHVPEASKPPASGAGEEHESVGTSGSERAIDGNTPPRDSEGGTEPSGQSSIAKGESPETSENVEGAPAAPDKSLAKVALIDGSVVVAKLVGGVIRYKSPFGELDVPVTNIQSLSSDELELKDGTRLKGEPVGGALSIETQFGKHDFSVSDITSVTRVEENGGKQATK